MALDSFITVQDLSDLTGYPLASDNGAQLAVDAACDICRAVAECSFNYGTATVTLDGAGTDALILPEHPVNTVGTVLVNGTAETAFTWTEDGLLFRGSAGCNAGVWFGWPTTTGYGYTSYWPVGRQNVQVTYEYGYPDGEVPRDVQRVARSIARREIIQGSNLRETVGQNSVAYAVAADELTNNELRILHKYRRTRSF